MAQDPNTMSTQEATVEGIRRAAHRHGLAAMKVAVAEDPLAFVAGKSLERALVENVYELDMSKAVPPAPGTHVVSPPPISLEQVESCERSPACTAGMVAGLKKDVQVDVAPKEANGSTGQPARKPVALGPGGPR
jgi:hypothetical protein